MENSLQISLDENRFKSLLKEVILEILRERPNLFQEVIEEALEDIVLTQAIREGEKTETVSRAEIFKLLEA